jgi:hypothetical protein
MVALKVESMVAQMDETKVGLKAECWVELSDGKLVDWMAAWKAVCLAGELVDRMAVLWGVKMVE